jgi:cytoskeletal protein RodZ
MAAPRPKSRDFGAALAGLVLGGSVMFLIILTIVWLTNSHFAKEKVHEAKEPPQAVLPASGPVPSTTGSGTSAPVAPTTSPASGTPAPAPAKR